MQRTRSPDQLQVTRSPGAGATARDLFAAGGELGALMAAKDWAATSLGPVESWPRALVTTVRIVLTSRQPMFVWWGDDLINLYNDAYCAILGGKHPEALGQPASVVWREIWDQVGPRAASAMSRNEGTYDESLLLIMERYGYREETYYTFSYCPVPNDEGGAGGIFCANTADTERIIGERQIMLLRELAERTAEARTVPEACVRSAAALATNPRDLPFALLYLLDPGRRTLELVGRAGIEEDHPSAVPAVRLGEASPWPFGEALATGVPVEVGRGRLPARLPTGAWPEPPERVVLIPIAGSGETGRTAVLVAGLNPYRLLDTAYRGFLLLVGGQIGAAIANADAYEQERRRAESLAELDRAKTAFFSNVSHEFRTPLTLMLGPLQDLVEAPNLDADVREQLGVTRRNALRLLKLVNSLLDFSRLEAGRVEARYEPLDLAALTTDLASIFRSAIERAGLRLVVDCPPLPAPVYVDRDMWEKIVLNLLSNALKFTFEGEIRVALRAEDGRVLLSVSDTGTGIPADALPHVFERFRRVQNARARTFEGTGIGLALVHELVKLHCGQVSLVSEVGHGTTFEITLPTGREHLPSAQVVPSRGEAAATGLGAAPFVEEAQRWLPEAEPAETITTTGELLVEGGEPRAEHGVGATLARILVADDNADMREYVKRLLGAHWTVEAVADGRAALERALADPPDLVLSDVMMPGLDGFALLQALRAEPTTRDIPIMLLSARAGEEARVQGLHAGADDYLVKPFSARELTARVGGALELARVRKDAAAALREREQQFETLFVEAPLGVYLVDDEFRISQINPTARPVFGDIPDLVGRDFGEVLRILWPGPYVEEVVRLFRHTLETGEPYTAPEEMHERRDRGVSEIYEWQISRIPLPNGRFGVVCYFRDISAQVQARAAIAESQERLRQAAKMESIGRLAGGLAHDFNNQLHALRGFVGYAARDPGISEQSLQDLDEVRKAVDRMAHLTGQLLAFSRQQVLRPEILDLDQAVSDSQELLRRLIGSQVEFRIEHGPGAKWVRVDRAQLQQILLNLCINARDAMPDGGRLAVRTALSGVAPAGAAREPGPTAVEGGPFVQLSVSDTGTGILPEHLPHIFEPFFTTKEVGKGTGLGLATVHGIVAQSGGHIWAESGDGRGAQFTVLLPVAPAPERGETAEPPSSPARASQSRILVVEDEDAVRSIVARTLRDEGYQVVEAGNGGEALTRLEESAGAIALVLTDMVMPSMGGRELGERLARERPDLPLVYMSGHPRDTAFADGAGALDHPFLQKPVPTELLVRTIADELIRARSPRHSSSVAGMSATLSIQPGVAP
jgi:PAS domain S-box-containing protein